MNSLKTTGGLTHVGGRQSLAPVLAIYAIYTAIHSILISRLPPLTHTLRLLCHFWLRKPLGRNLLLLLSSLELVALLGMSTPPPPPLLSTPSTYININKPPLCCWRRGGGPRAADSETILCLNTYLIKEPEGGGLTCFFI